MKTGKLGFLVIGAVFVVLTAFSAQSDARVDVNVGIGIPAYEFSGPPPMAVIPGTYVYMVPDIDADILFYQGYWFRPYEGRWYRSRSYNGPWGFISLGRVPRALVGLPPDYRRIHAEHRRIPHAEFNKNWKRWERDRYWEKDQRWREGRHEGGRDERREGHGERGRRD